MLKRHINEQDDTIQKQDLEFQRLNSTLKQIDDDILGQKKEYDQLIHRKEWPDDIYISSKEQIASEAFDQKDRRGEYVC